MPLDKLDLNNPRSRHAMPRHVIPDLNEQQGYSGHGIAEGHQRVGGIPSELLPQLFDRYPDQAVIDRHVFPSDGGVNEPIVATGKPSVMPGFPVWGGRMIQRDPDGGFSRVETHSNAFIAFALFVIPRVVSDRCERLSAEVCDWAGLPASDIGKSATLISFAWLGFAIAFQVTVEEPA